MQGQRQWASKSLSMRADFEWLKPDKRREFLRVRINAQGGLERYANQSSAVLTSTVWADGLADIAPGLVVRQGDRVPYLSFNHGFGAR